MGGMKPVMSRGRTEIPQMRFGVTGKQRIASDLVARPFPNRGRRDVTDIVVVETEQGAKI